MFSGSPFCQSWCYCVFRGDSTQRWPFLIMVKAASMYTSWIQPFFWERVKISLVHPWPLFHDIVHVLVKTLRNSISVYWEFGLHWDKPAVTTGNKQARRVWFTCCCCCLSSNCRNSKPLPRPAAYWRPGWNMFTENSGCLISEGGLWIFPSRWYFPHSSGLLNHLFTSDPAGAPV